MTYCYRSLEEAACKALPIGRWDQKTKVLGYTSIALITVMSGERVNDPGTYPNLSQVHTDPFFFLLSFCPKFFWRLRFMM